MSTRIDSLLNTFDVSRDTSQFNLECLAGSVRLTHANKVVQNLAYEPPTPADIAQLKEITGQTTGDLARFACVDKRKINAWVSQRGFEKGERIPSSVWSALLESADLTQRFTLKPRYADIREDVLRTTQVIPTKHELFLITGIAGKSLEQLATESSLPIELLKANVIRGQFVFDENDNFIPNDNPDLLSKIQTVTAKLTLDQWASLRTAFGIEGISFLTMPPQVRNCTLSNKIDPRFSTGKGKGDRTTESSIVELPELVKKDPQELANYDYSKETAFFEHFEGLYSPPTHKELRQIFTWTGYTLAEIALIMDIRVRDLTFLMSHHSVRERENQNNEPKRAKIQFVKYYQWRRLLEVFNLVPQHKILINR